METITDTIATLEEHISVLEHAFSDPSIDPSTLRERTSEYSESQEKLEQLLNRWEYLEQKAQNNTKDYIPPITKKNLPNMI